MLSAIRNITKTSTCMTVRLFQTTSPQLTEDRSWNQKKIAVTDEGAHGEKVLDLDSMIKLKQNIFPSLNSDDVLYDGVPYKKLPIINVRVSRNNTVISMTDCDGNVKIIRSCGMDGFKNTKKGTNIAAQTTAINLAMKTIEKGVKTVRVRMQGLGPGRLTAVKGLQMGGLDIISVTDCTLVSWNPPRPRKARRL